MSIDAGSRRAGLVLAGVVICAVTLALLAGSAGALVQGEPDLSLTVADNRLTAGDSTTLDIAVVNRGDLSQGSDQGNTNAESRVTTARGLTIEPSSTGPITVRTNEIAVGNLPDGETRTATINVAVADDAEPGTYEIPVDIEYRHTELVSEQDTRTLNDDDVSIERTVTVVVDEDARFDIISVDPQGPGETGTFRVTIDNNGSATANDAVVSLTSLSSDLTFGEGDASAAYIEEWPADDRRTLLYRGSVAENAPTSALPASLSVDYTDDENVGFTSESTFGITPQTDQTFSIDAIDSTLRVGQDGTISGVITNDGPNPVDNLVVTLQPPSTNVNVLEPELALGDLTPGEEVTVTFDIEVSTASRAGPRQFTLQPEYETLDGEDRTADPIRFRETVQPRRDVVTVETTDRTVAPGGESRVVLQVTNNRDVPLSDVSAKVFTSQPLSVPDDEAFVDHLDPNETVDLPIRVAAADTAMTKTYPISVDFQYVDPDGETRLTESYRVPIDVTDSDDGFFGIFGLLGIGLSTSLVVGPLLLYRRR